MDWGIPGASNATPAEGTVYLETLYVCNREAPDGCRVKLTSIAKLVATAV